MPLACQEASAVQGALAWVVILAGFAAWLAVTVLIVRSARDRKEQRLLVALLIGSIALGPALIAAYYAGRFGDDSSTGKLLLLLLIPGAIGAAIALATRAGRGLRAFVVSTWGAIFLGGFAIFALYAALAFGGGCIE